MTTWLLGLSIVLAGGLVVRVFQLRRRMAALESARYRLERQHTTRQQERHQETLLREGLFSVMDDALLVLDRTGVISHANPAAQELFKQPCTGQTLIHATRHYELEDFVQLAADKPHEVLERRLVVGDHILQVRVLNIDACTLILLHDVTVMQQLSRARREMIANISHELNTPITTIGLLADTLLGGAAENADLRQQMLDNIKVESQTLSQLVQEMRDLSLIESRQMPIKMVPTPLWPLVQRSVEPLVALAQRKEQHIEYDVPDDIAVLADENQLPRVIKNIVHNAIKFTPEGGQIAVKATMDGDEVTIAISDSGPGISATDLPRIFERFFQADQSRQHGTGLGLAIARHIVLGHGGEIWARNNPDRGATFAFTLPNATT